MTELDARPTPETAPQPSVALRASEPQLTLTLPKWAVLASGGVLMIALAPGYLYVAGLVHPGPQLHQIALFGHLASLVLGLGAVLSVDWVALLWCLRRRAFADVLKTAHNGHVPIWAGYGGLVLTGILLEPHLDLLRTQVKLVLVLLVGLNGLCAMWLHLLLLVRPKREVLIASVVCASVSQICWWSATVIGAVNAH